MNKLINICKNYSGIREDITEAEEATVLDLIRTEFKNLSAEEVATAFKMNASGRKWTSIAAYQTFSPIFVGQVLKEYNEFKRKENMKPKRIEASHQIENKVDPINERKVAFEFIEKVYKESNQFPIIANWSDAFLHAELNGIINLSIEDKEIVKKEVIQEIKLNQLNKRIETGIKGNTSELEDKNLKVLCRKRTLQNHFKNKTT